MLSGSRSAIMDLATTPLRPSPAPVTGKRFRRRAGAYIIDALALTAGNYAILLAVAVAITFALTLAGHKVQANQQASNPYLNFGIGVLLNIVYFAVFETLYGATLGKLILGMRVVKDDGQPCDLGAALVRGGLLYIDGLFFGLVAYGNMKAPLYQRIGDRSARTLVVGSKEAFIQQPRAGWWFVAAGAIYVTICTVASVWMLAGVYS
jgi:uncharacterized RDD family membrane protein YckC